MSRSYRFVVLLVFLALLCCNKKEEIKPSIGVQAESIDFRKFTINYVNDFTHESAERIIAAEANKFPDYSGKEIITEQGLVYSLSDTEARGRELFLHIENIICLRKMKSLEEIERAIFPSTLRRTNQIYSYENIHAIHVYNVYDKKNKRPHRIYVGIGRNHPIDLSSKLVFLACSE